MDIDLNSLGAHIFYEKCVFTSAQFKNLASFFPFNLHHNESILCHLCRIYAVHL